MPLVRDATETDFRRLADDHRGELLAHCYRMLGSLHDAEDALQETLLRAWRGLPDFGGRSSVRTWLYTIATNVCMDVLGRRSKRVLPMDYDPPSPPTKAAGEPLIESVWVEPYPDEALRLPDGPASPDARYEQREAVELAFVAALQHLPANQRAVLILREVLGFSAPEVADALDTTPVSVNSALQRARKTVDEKLPAQSQQATLRALGDEKLGEIVEKYMDALGRGDVDAVVAMLAEDACWSMPPLASWFRGPDVRGWLARGPLSGAFRWHHIPTRASGQPAVGVYNWDEGEQAYLPFALDVITLEGDRIKEVTAFITRRVSGVDPEYYARFPDQEVDGTKVADFFERFGLPARV